MKQIIRIDKGDGTESVENNENRVSNMLNDYIPQMREAIANDFWAGKRHIENSFAIYEVREVEVST